MIEVRNRSKGVIILTVILLLLGTFFTGDNVHANSSEAARIKKKYAKFDIRTAPPSHVSGADIDALYKKKLHTNSKLATTGDLVFKAGERHGINPIFMATLMIYESGWGKSDIALRNNNFGGIRSTKRYKKGGNTKWAYFDSIEEGIDELAGLLRRYTLGGIKSDANPNGDPMVTFEDMLNTYAPSFENDQDKYINAVGGYMEQLEQGVDGSLLSADGSILDEDGDFGDNPNYFITPHRAEDVGGGVQLGDAPVGTELSNWVFTFSEGTRKLLMTIGGILSAAILVYMIVYVLGHLVLLRNGLIPFSVTDKLGLPDKTGILSFWELMKRLGLGLLIIAFFWTGLHVNVMAWIINFIANLPIF